MQHSPRRKKKRALIDAIARGDFEGVKQAVSSGLPLNFNYWSHHSWGSCGSPLSVAMSKKDPAIAEFLIAHGASLSPQSRGNGALLTNAVRGGNIELVKLALAAGHDIHFSPAKHPTPLAQALQNQAIPLARFLISKGARKEDLTRYARRWFAMRTETILFVREQGIEVPQKVLDAIAKGEWDRRTPKENTKNGGVGG
jgi:ankyrin repeat protein